MDLNELVQVADDKRDLSWENSFFQELCKGNLKLLSQDPQVGPDGWPYLLTETSVDAKEPSQNIIQWLATKGIGLVVNPQKEYPDFVFNWGMLWHFKETGYFYRAQSEVPVGTIELQEGDSLIAGPPTDEYLPKYVRGILKEFFRDQGLLAVKILVLSKDKKHYDLAISLESLKNPPEKEHQGIAEAISWFLPPHYSLLLVSENGLPAFTDL